MSASVIDLVGISVTYPLDLLNHKVHSSYTIFGDILVVWCEVQSGITVSISIVAVTLRLTEVLQASIVASAREEAVIGTGAGIRIRDPCDMSGISHLDNRNNCKSSVGQDDPIEVLTVVTVAARNRRCLLEA